MKREELIKMLQGDTTSRQAGIKLLVQDFDLRDRIQNLVKSKGANIQQAQDIYHDVVMATVKAIVKRKPVDSIESYMFGIARYKWYDTLKGVQADRKEQNELPPGLLIEESILDQVLQSERAELLHGVLGHLRSRCKEVLLLWGSGYNMTEIAERLDYKSAGMVRKKKSQCLKSLVEYLDAKPILKESLQK